MARAKKVSSLVEGESANLTIAKAIRAKKQNVSNAAIIAAAPSVADVNMQQIDRIAALESNIHMLTALLTGIRGDNATVDETYTSKLRHRWIVHSIVKNAKVSFEAALGY